MLEKEALYVLLTWVNSVTENAFCVWSSRWPMCRVDSTVPGKLSQHVIEVICNNNSTQVRCFQGGPTHQAIKCLPCCCLSAMPFPDVLLLDHVSINVNVFWFVKRV